MRSHLVSAPRRCFTFAALTVLSLVVTAATIIPSRLHDTRTGAGTAQGEPGAVEAGSVTSVDPAGTGAVPAESVTGMVLNVTATEPDTAGYLSVYPCGQEPPNSSNVNFAAGATVPNLVVVASAVFVRLDSSARLCLHSTARTDFVLDMAGYSTAPAV